MASRAPNNLSELRQFFRTHGQDHVFRFWDRLEPAGRERLLAQARRIGADLPGFLEARELALATLADRTPGRIEPLEAIRLPRTDAERRRFEAARDLGRRLLVAGRVGVLVVAGGQGSRLGFPGPKGAYPLGPVSGRSLFELQAQKIRGLARRSRCRVPWYVMTSESTRSQTLDFFQAEKYFGLPPEDVFFLVQQSVPACGLGGEFLLDRPDHIFENPNGHGGALPALLASGALDDMRERGVDRLFYYQVDNPLVRIADPLFLGLHEENGAEMSCKVVRKRDAEEKVGVLARVNGRPGIVEYTELGETERRRRDDDGELVYWAGNIATHVFNTDFIRRVAGEADRVLPYHASLKTIPALDESDPATERSGYKLERFVFDALPQATRICALEVVARDEFAPIKNAQGSDSPQTSRQALDELYRRWLAGSGIELPTGSGFVELDHSRIDDAEEALSSGFATLAEAGEAIRVATGMD